MRIYGLVLAAILLSLAATASSPAWAYLDAEAAYRMALRHHYPLGAKRKNYKHAMLLYCRADSDDHDGYHRLCHRVDVRQRSTR